MHDLLRLHHAVARDGDQISHFGDTCVRSFGSTCTTYSECTTLWARDVNQISDGDDTCFPTDEDLGTDFVNSDIEDIPDIPPDELVSLLSVHCFPPEQCRETEDSIRASVRRRAAERITQSVTAMYDSDDSVPENVGHGGWVPPASLPFSSLEMSINRGCFSLNNGRDAVHTDDTDDKVAVSCQTTSSDERLITSLQRRTVRTECTSLSFKSTSDARSELSWTGSKATHGPRSSCTEAHRPLSGRRTERDPRSSSSTEVTDGVTQATWSIYKSRKSRRASSSSILASKKHTTTSTTSSHQNRRHSPKQRKSTGNDSVCCLPFDRATKEKKRLRTGNRLLGMLQMKYCWDTIPYYTISNRQMLLCLCRTTARIPGIMHMSPYEVDSLACEIQQFDNLTQ